MTYSRSDLLLADATMNQLRNAIYHLGRFLNKNGIDDLKVRFREMGKNIAKTYYKHWNPIEEVTLTNIKDLIIDMKVWYGGGQSSFDKQINEALDIFELWLRPYVEKNAFWHELKKTIASAAKMIRKKK